MFETFSFDASRSPSVDSDTTTPSLTHSRSVSPCSTISPWPTPSYSVTDLAADFHRQRLRQDSHIYSQPCESYANLDDDAGWTLEEQETADLPAVLSRTRRSYSPTRRRLDRQAHSRLLCSSAHHRDIATLVSRMINGQEQCIVQPPTSVSYATSDTECESPDMATLSRVSSSLSVTKSRRASDLHKTGACISKDIRFRKEKPRRQKSSDK